ncbi:nucleotide-diphospho-sugar transferase [Zalerion maritima]|uniref:Nucleotide-diphospho-sugar transferase n=1 Tax=Zalerion maritima TaxID=339359 RepID=A0AAD5WQX2_9PEZI|nr:nucleotide-diphospho-sugar transferase [Zalerion maritima]
MTVDDTEDVGEVFAVKRIWVPGEGNKERRLPRVKHRYTIANIGPEGTKGTLLRQAQDLEYKLAGMNKFFQWNFWGSKKMAFFDGLEFGAELILGDHIFLISLHLSPPRFIPNLSHTLSLTTITNAPSSAPATGSKWGPSSLSPREAPPNLGFNGTGNRGGYGKVTVISQRFHRWDILFFFFSFFFFFFFFLFFMRRIFTNNSHLLSFSWHLGRHEAMAKKHGSSKKT